MDDFKISVKGFVVKDKKVLIVRRALDDAHKPGIWEPLGGRLEFGENPFLGLKREIKEEANIDVDVLNPLDVKHFTREDGQKITMILFLCKALNDEVRLTEEHIEFEWVEIDKLKDKLNDFFHTSIDNIKKFV
jgi:mutator protein MutT